MKVMQLMKQRVVTCHAEDTLNSAAQIMWEHDIGSVPVVDSDGRVVGMITDRDICMAAYTQGGPLRELCIKDAMSKTLLACKPDDSVAQAERVMRTHQIRRLPVVDAFDRLVGILSLNDLAWEAEHEGGAKKRQVSFSEVGQTLAAVCKPHVSREVIASA